jgi:superfamily II DNA/RNA helicase
MKCEQLIIQTKLLAKLQEQEFKELTLIQEKCIPEIVLGKDVVGQAETGSGKTLAVCLPILNKITPRQGLQALVLTPTRELCVQVTDVFKDFGKTLGIRTTSVYGGVSIGPQIHDIRTSEIVIGTPGRMLDHLRRRTIDLSNIKILVLDETDKMFEMGFVDDVEEIIRQIPQQRQLLMRMFIDSQENI